MATKHNLSKHPLFNVWVGIIRRCYTPSFNMYKRYGANGVRVCDLWRYNFKEFYDWAISNGWEKGMQIDKDIIPKKIGIPALLYSPEMCSIVTPKENSNNKSNNRYMEYKGEIKTLTQWAESIGVKKVTFFQRVNKYGLEKALLMPYQKAEPKPVKCVSTNEIFASINEASRAKNIGAPCIARVLKGERNHTHGLIFKFLN